MAVFAIMIRLDYGDDYSKRYSETVEAIRRQAGGGAVWEEPTSTYILQSGLSAVGLCDAIYYAAPIYEARDTIAVLDLSSKGPGSYAAKGLAYPATFKSLMDAR